MKTSYPRKLASLAAILVLAGCSKKADVAPVAAAAQAPAPATGSVSVVGDSEKSRHFEAVNKHLELGGTLYGYVDIDGDIMNFAAPVQAAVKELSKTQPALSMFAKQDFKDLFKTLGLDDVKAVGASSVKQADGMYRNRSFIYTPDGRHGLMAIFGGSPAPFENTRLAPADVDYFSEFDFDLGAIYDVTNSIIEKVNGPKAAEDFRAKLNEAGALAYLGLLKGHATIIVKLDPVKNLTLPQPVAVSIPAFSALIKLHISVPALESQVKSNPRYEASTSGSMRVYTLKAASPVEGLKLIFGFDGTDSYLFTSEEFMNDCLSRKDGLDKNPAFVARLADLGPEGNGLAWISPAFLSRLKEMASMNDRAPGQIHKFLETYTASIPDATQPMMSVRTNLPDGILMRSVWNRSLKADLATLAVYNPLTVGFLAAMAIPAFENVRRTSELVSVQNNLAMLYGAADGYFAEHPGITACRYSDLVGPDKVIKEMKPSLGEDYTQLIIYKGQTIKIKLPDGRVIPFNPAMRRAKAQGPANAAPAPHANQDPSPGDPPDAAAIKANLRTLSMAANAYYKATGTTSTSFDKLVGPDKAIPSMPSVAGENYHSLLFVKGHPLRVYLKDGRSFVYWPQ